jgi:hypothetical protein
MDPDIIKKNSYNTTHIYYLQSIFLEDITYDTNTRGGNESWS